MSSSRCLFSSFSNVTIIVTDCCNYSFLSHFSAFLKSLNCWTYAIVSVRTLSSTFVLNRHNRCMTFTVCKDLCIVFSFIILKSIRSSSPFTIVYLFRISDERDCPDVFFLMKFLIQCFSVVSCSSELHFYNVFFHFSLFDDVCFQYSQVFVLSFFSMCSNTVLIPSSNLFVVSLFHFFHYQYGTPFKTKFHSSTQALYFY